MKKKLAAVMAGAALMLAAGSASALSIFNGTTLLTNEGCTYNDTGAQSVVLTDTDGYNDDATAFLFLELAGYANSNTLGIYSFTDNGSTVALGNTLQVFSGAQSPFTSVTLKFDLAEGTVENGTTHATAYIGKNFGFYISTPDTNTFYTHSSLNSGGYDYFKVYDTRDNRAGSLGGSDVVLAIEDLLNGGDKDFDDMVIGVTDVAPVPEPGTFAMLGAGLLGLGLYGRRKAKK